MDFYIIALVLFLALTFLARYLNERALRKLSDEEKVLLVDQFSGLRVFNIGILLGILVAFFAFLYLDLIPETWSLVIYIVAVVGLVLVNMLYTLKVLKQKEVNEEYIKTYVITSSLRLLGLALVIGSLTVIM